MTTTQVAGPGNLIISAPALFTGSVTVNQGTLTLSGGGSLLAQGTSNTYTVNAGAALTLDNTGTNNGNRLSNGAGNTLTLNGGAFNVISNASTASSQTVGPLALGAGSSVISSTQSGTANQAVTFAGLASAPATGSYRLLPGRRRGAGGSGQRQPDRVHDAPADDDHDGRLQHRDPGRQFRPGLRHG